MCLWRDQPWELLLKVAVAVALRATVLHDRSRMLKETGDDYGRCGLIVVVR